MDIYTLEQNLNCAICWSIPKVPYQSNCCGHIFCYKCTQELISQKCSLCRSEKATFSKNKFASKLLDEIKIMCNYGCESFINLNKMHEHRYTCEKYEFTCSINSCKFKGSRENALKHIVNSHGFQAIMFAENIDKFTPFLDKIVKKLEYAGEDSSFNKDNTTNSIIDISYDQ